MINTKAISPALLETILEIGEMDTIVKYGFSLGGGTNLALRYGHRISQDIDLFCPEIIGLEGFANVKKDLLTHYKNKIVSITYPNDKSDQYAFSRVLIRKGDEFVKLELIQNTKKVKDVEINESIKMLSILDVGLMKLLAVADRMTKKDVYDLDLITNEIPLTTLFTNLKEKQQKYNKPEDKSIFDLDESRNPAFIPELLLAFDSIGTPQSKLKPSHLQDTLDIIEGSKSWYEAKLSWRMKVRGLFRALNLEFPENKGRKF